MGEGARRRQQRSIAAQDDHQVRLALGHLLALDAVYIRPSRRYAALSIQNAAPSALGEPGAQLGQDRFQFVLLRLGDNSS